LKFARRKPGFGENIRIDVVRIAEPRQYWQYARRINACTATNPIEIRKPASAGQKDKFKKPVVLEEREDRRTENGQIETKAEPGNRDAGYRGKPAVQNFLAPRRQGAGDRFPPF
jgi:hypothetical protein